MLYYPADNGILTDTERQINSTQQFPYRSKLSAGLLYYVPLRLSAPLTVTLWLDVATLRPAWGQFKCPNLVSCFKESQMFLAVSKSRRNAGGLSTLIQLEGI